MKALLVGHGDGNHPQTTWEVDRKTEVDNNFAEG